MKHERHLKKVYQDKFGNIGNCQSATIATILELKLEDVPWFAEVNLNDSLTDDEKSSKFWDDIDNFLALHNYEINTVDYTEELSKSLKGYYLVAGKTDRGFMHSVVYKDHKLYHDPHPDGNGVIPEYIDIITPINN